MMRLVRDWWEGEINVPETIHCHDSSSLTDVVASNIISNLPQNILRRKIVFNQIIAPLLDKKFKLRLIKDSFNVFPSLLLSVNPAWICYPTDVVPTVDTPDNGCGAPDTPQMVRTPPGH